MVDPGSSPSLIDVATAEKFNLKINPSIKLNLQGVGADKCAGFCVAPVWIQQKDRPNTWAQLDVEFHVLEYLAPKMILGRDFLNDYGIDWYGFSRLKENAGLVVCADASPVLLCPVDVLRVVGQF